MASDWPSKEPMVAASSTPGALTSRLSQQTAKSSWFWLVNIILIPLVCFFWCLYIFGLNDGKKFCATASERDAMNPPAFLHNPASNTHNNTGGRACIYDIVDYVNGFRAGKDKLVGTNDDRLSLSEQMELLNRLFRQEFPGSYWSNSTWFFNHNAAVLGQMQLLYADANEYLAFFGSSLPSTGYSGTHSYDCYDFQIDGEAQHFTLGQFDPILVSPNWRKKRQDGIETSELGSLLTRGQKKGYAQRNGGFMVEYGYGNLIPSIYDGIIMPTIFISNDFFSMFTTLKTLAEGIIANRAPVIAKFIRLYDESKANNNPKISQSAAGTAKRAPRQVVE
eukprot:GHVU01161850.1.p1 GENE.GHVU01161850.1~~GHVU01161850.1.p1  ORF type:complete len:335 (+),score=52.99 GHVU01161850.1:223-1227(+)